MASFALYIPIALMNRLNETESVTFILLSVTLKRARWPVFCVVYSHCTDGQTQRNRVCYFHFTFLHSVLPKYFSFSSIYFTTAVVKCNVEPVKRFPVLQLSVGMITGPLKP